MKLALPTMPEATNPEYSCVNTGGVETEVGQFLYGLVRLTKPLRILETGTHKGISASYMATALKENGKGSLTTIEFDPGNCNESLALFTALMLNPYVQVMQMDAATYPVTPDEFDIIFLDTEPHLRFAEFVRYFPALKPGGFIGIHDLGPHLGQNGLTVNGLLNWPFGPLPAEMKEMLKQVQSFHFPSPRGFYLGQKRKAGFYE